jgi:hypothetical protein
MGCRWMGQLSARVRMPAATRHRSYQTSRLPRIQPTRQTVAIAGADGGRPSAAVSTAPIAPAVPQTGAYGYWSRASGGGSLTTSQYRPS